MRKPIPHRGFTVLVLLAIASPAGWADRPRGVREIPVEILRYADGAATGKPPAASGALDLSVIVGPPEVGAYLVRFRPLPGERIVVARGVIRDGFTPRTRRQTTGRAAARLLGSLGYHLVLREVPGDLHKTVGPLAGMLLPGRPGWNGKPRPARVLVLRADTLHQRDGHAAALVMLEANALTRIEFPKILTRRGAGRSGRGRARSASVPVRAGPEIGRERMLQLIAGGPDGAGSGPVVESQHAVRERSAPAAPTLPLAPRERSGARDRGGFGPPRP